ncbi:plant-specific domain TIGR01589 family protein [Musa troglodytarum]|uniref:Plant-specific domain TIGR01589 family protein n=1 Tax=Musa troglodytarum TaxID=320322 RepID=A0A9E7EAE3_9LILI|nr:plant-specific domain TIGR01589 family protein [Musa troglodytarum]
MSSGEVRKVSRQDVQLVQNLIERCLQLYMNQKEVVDTLSFQAKIEPSFTELVWQKLEEENREFFKAYHIRLILKNQILLFNKLLEKQVELMQKACSSEVAILPIPNASNSPLLQTPSCYMSQHASASSRPDGMFYNGDFSSALVNGRSSEHQGNYLGSDSSIVAGIMHASTSVVSANSSNMGRISGLSETIIKSEPNYLNNSEFPFVNDSIILEVHQPIGDASGGSFSNSELTGQPANSTLQDVDIPSLGFSQIPRNFSFSDLADDFTHCADILENYDKSPYLPPDSSNFLDSPASEFKG